VAPSPTSSTGKSQPLSRTEYSARPRPRRPRGSVRAGSLDADAPRTCRRPRRHGCWPGCKLLLR
jgi:hypothetical protein